MGQEVGVSPREQPPDTHEAKADEDDDRADLVASWGKESGEVRPKSSAW